MGYISRLTIGDIEATNDILSEGFIINVSRDDGTDITDFAVSDTLLLGGQVYDTFYADFQASCNTTGQPIPVIIELDCCAQAFEFETNLSAMRFSATECEVEVALLGSNDKISLFAYLNTYTWWQAPGVLETSWPRIKYMDEPSFWQQLFDFAELPAFFDPIDYNTSRNHNYWFAPNVSEVLQMACQAGGGTFHSESIFGIGNYSRMLMTASTQIPGDKVDQASTQMRPEQLPLETTLQLLDNLAEVFNARIEILNNEVRFETDTWYRTNAPILFDLETEAAAQRLGPDIRIQTAPNKTYGVGIFEYMPDAIDKYAHRARSIFSGIVNWNPDRDHEKQSRLTVQVPFSPCHVIGDLAYLRAINTETQATRNTEWSIWRDTVIQNEYMQYSATGITAFPKLLIENYDPGILAIGAPFEFVHTELLDVTEYGWEEGTNYPTNRDPKKANKELSFDPEEPEGLFQRFWQSEDPSLFQSYQVDSLVWYPDNFCEAVSTIRQYGLRIAFDTALGKALPESLKIDFEEQSITFTDCLIKSIC